MPRRADMVTSHGLREAIVARFADGQWHSLDEVAASCGHLIPPEIGIRVYRRDGLKKLPSLAEQVESGRRWVISVNLRKLGAEPDPGRAKYKWHRFRLPPGGEYGLCRGERRYNARVTEAQVREIRLRHAFGSVTMSALAEEYGVSMSTIQAIVHRKTWRTVA